MDYASFPSGESWAYREMRQKESQREAFFSLRKQEPQPFRPTSVATEFVDTDWDEEEMESEPEENSPRASLQSSGQPSFTTVSSYDEALTPRSSRGREFYIDHQLKQVEGPRGPHLFYGSPDPYLMQHEHDEGMIMALSPITPKYPHGLTDMPQQSPFARRTSPSQLARAAELDVSSLPSWSPQTVAHWMVKTGIDPAVSERFILNDINGEILMTLKFEDLKELDIHSFGIRTKVWQQIQALKDSQQASPIPPTPMEESPSRASRREAGERNNADAPGPRGDMMWRRRYSADDTVDPMDSVSIIGIEQVIPKPHSCPKGENCSKWKRQQRLIEDFKRTNPHIDLNASGTVMIYGDAGNPETARALDPNEISPPFSNSIPSMVASSDVLGPGGGLTPLQYYQEAALRNFQAVRDPQEGVRQFLNFHNQNSEEIPPTPPFEIFPAGQPHHGLRRLPKLSKLSIPEKPQVPGESAAPSRGSNNSSPQPQQPTKQVSNQQQQQQQQQQPQQPQQRRQSSPLQHEFVPYRMERANAISPDLDTTQNLYRFGTPFSEVDVPITSVPLGPVAREASQSVPPDMNYRMPTSSSSSNGHFRSQSRASGRRPSFVVLPSLDENKPAGISPKSASSGSTSPRTSSPKIPSRPQQAAPAPTHAPPRFNYPWSPERTAYEQAVPPTLMTRSSSAQEGRTAAAIGANTTETPSSGISFQGPMKKRKTRMLRHEWQDGYFTLKGTRLNMHKDARQIDRTLEYVDIDDYAIACSSAATTSKLSAAFKAVSISHDRKKSDPVGAFSFQLIPQDKNSLRFRKRDSAVPGPAGSPAEGVNGTGKTHHFAVKGRDDRIDWMRELMLAKALKQKGEGFEIRVNGNMI